MNAEVVIKYDSPPECTHGAGILLYMTRPVAEGHEVAFVLSQESFVKDWNQSGCWSAFEGGAKPNEGCEETAAREFVEETSGSIPLFGTTDPRAIAAQLREQQYAFRICVNRSVKTAPRRDHVTFLVRVPWGAEVHEMFHKTYDPLSHFDQCVGSAALADERARSLGSDDPRRAAMQDEVLRRRQRAADCYRDLPVVLRQHPGVRGELERVVPDYLEKRDVRVVSLRHVQHVLHRRDTRVVPHGLRMRYSFVPVIKAAIQALNSEGGVLR